MLRGCPVIYSHSGRGNNWAHGYRQPGEGSSGYEDEGFSDSFGGSGPREDGRVLIDALRAIRRVMEPTDGRGSVFEDERPTDILLVYSLAGGTGSGLGSRLLHELRAAYPKVLLLAAVVAPNMASPSAAGEAGGSAGGGGDTPTQSYNVVLAMKKLRDHADAVFIFSNVAILAALERERTAGVGVLGRARARGGGSSISLGDINRCIGAALALTLIPGVGRETGEAGEIHGVERRAGNDGGGSASTDAWFLRPDLHSPGGREGEWKGAGSLRAGRGGGRGKRTRMTAAAIVEALVQDPSGRLKLLEVHAVVADVPSPSSSPFSMVTDSSASSEAVADKAWKGLVAGLKPSMTAWDKLYGGGGMGTGGGEGTERSRTTSAVVILRGCDSKRGGCDTDDLLHTPPEGSEAATVAAALAKASVLTHHGRRGKSQPAPAVGYWSHRHSAPCILRSAAGMKTTNLEAAQQRRRQQSQPSPLQRSLTVVAHRSTAGGFLTSVAERARRLLDSGAYLHWYERYGCTRNDIAEAIDACLDVARAYREG